VCGTPKLALWVAMKAATVTESSHP